MNLFRYAWGSRSCDPPSQSNTKESLSGRGSTKGEDRAQLVEVREVDIHYMSPRLHLV